MSAVVYNSNVMFTNQQICLHFVSFFYKSAICLQVELISAVSLHVLLATTTMSYYNGIRAFKQGHTQTIWP